MTSRPSVKTSLEVPDWRISDQIVADAVVVTKCTL